MDSLTGVKFIEQNYPNAKWSKFFYGQSVLDAAGVTHVWTIDLEDQGVRAIYLHYIYYPDKRPVGQFTGNFGENLFDVTATITNLWTPVPYIVEGGHLTISFNAAGRFNTCYQYIT